MYDSGRVIILAEKLLKKANSDSENAIRILEEVLRYLLEVVDRAGLEKEFLEVLGD